MRAAAQGAAAAAAQRAAAATALAQACGSSAVHYFDADYLSDKEQARRMLESYDRELDAIAGKLVRPLGGARHGVARHFRHVLQPTAGLFRPNVPRSQPRPGFPCVGCG